MLASVVLLPEPVGPVTRNKPRGRWHKLFNDRRRAQLFERQQRVGNLPQHHADIAALLEDGNAEAAVIAEGKTEVGTAHFGQFLLAAVGRDALHQGHGVVGLERFGFQLPHATVQTQHRRLADGNVQVAGALLDDRVQQFIDQQCAHDVPID